MFFYLTIAGRKTLAGYVEQSCSINQNGDIIPLTIMIVLDESINLTVF